MNKKLSELTEEDVKNLLYERFSKEDFKKLGDYAIKNNTDVLNKIDTIDKITKLNDEELKDLISKAEEMRLDELLPHQFLGYRVYSFDKTSRFLFKSHALLNTEKSDLLNITDVRYRNRFKKDQDNLEKAMKNVFGLDVARKNDEPLVVLLRIRGEFEGLSKFDNAVFNLICSFNYQADMSAVNLSDRRIAQELYENIKVNQEQLDRVNESIKRLTECDVIVDFEDVKNKYENTISNKKRKLNLSTTRIDSTKLLTYEGTKEFIKSDEEGNIVSASYKYLGIYSPYFLNIPYRFSQYQTVKKINDIKKSSEYKKYRRGEFTIAVREHLRTRILPDFQKNTTINYDTILAELGALEPSNRSKRIKAIDSVLSEMKEVGEIEDFGNIKKIGRKTVSFEVTKVDEKKKKKENKK